MTASNRLPTWVRIGVPLLVLLFASLLLSRPARAYALDPCTPNEPCAPLGIHLTPDASVIAANSDYVYAYVTGLGITPPEIAVFQAVDEGYVRIGSVPLDVYLPHRAVLQGSFLYLATESGGIDVVNIANPARPTVTHHIYLPESVHWIMGGQGALYVSTSRLLTSGEFYTLHVFSLAQPGEPTIVATLPGVSGSWARAAGNRLAIVTEANVRLYTLEEPLAPSNVATFTTVFTETAAPPSDVLLAGDNLYLMGRGIGETNFCRIVDVSVPSAPELGGACPFHSRQTTIAGMYAYVNKPPNMVSGYHDYQIYSLADTARPIPAGRTLQRWWRLLPAGDAFVATEQTGPNHLLGIVRYVQNADGTLTEGWHSWRESDYADHNTIALIDGDHLYVDRGASPEGQRVRIVDISARAAPRIAGEVVSPWINPQGMLIAGNLLASRTGGRIALFDKSDPAAVSLLGSIAPPAGEVFSGMVFGDAGRIFGATEQNSLISVDIRQPLTPAQTAQIVLPAAIKHLAYTGGYLYLFGESTLTIVDAREGRLEFVKSIPVGNGIAAVGAWDKHVFVVRPSYWWLEKLDVTDPTSPVAQRFYSDTDVRGYVERLFIQNGRVALLYYWSEPMPEEPGPWDPLAYEYSLLIYSLETTGPVLEVALIGLADDDVITDGWSLIFEGMLVLRPAGWQVPSAPLVQGDTFQPRPGITYTVASSPPDGEHCLTHSEPILATLPEDPAHGLVSGIYEVSLDRCGADGGQQLPITVTVAVDTGQPDAAIFLDRGDHWEPVPAALGAAAEAEVTATLQLPARWAVLGPPWPPVRLPIVFRQE